jgi:hypothetical protein
MGNHQGDGESVPVALRQEQPAVRDEGVKPLAREKQFDWEYWEVPFQSQGQEQQAALLRELLGTRPKDARAIEQFISRQDQDLRSRELKKQELLQAQVHKESRDCTFHPGASR